MDTNACDHCWLYTVYNLFLSRPFFEPGPSVLLVPGHCPVVLSEGRGKVMGAIVFGDKVQV